MSPVIVAALMIVVLLLVVMLPAWNTGQFNRLPQEQKVRVLMKQAKGLHYFKNVSGGKTGTLYYVKNKRKIYAFPWELKDGSMYCTRRNILENWDYPEEKPAFSDEEKQQAIQELQAYNQNRKVKLLYTYEPNQ